METMKGRRLSAADVDRMIQGIKTGHRLHASGAFSNSGLLGQSIIAHMPPSVDPGIIYCTLSGTVSFLNVVEVTGGLVAEHYGTPYAKVPTATHVPRLGIAENDGVLNGGIPVRIFGIGLVKYAWAGGSTVAAGGYLGSSAADGLAHENMSGPLQVITIADHDSGWTGFNYALVNIGTTYGIPDVWKTTAAPGGGTVTAKRVNSSGVVQGNNFTFTVL